MVVVRDPKKKNQPTNKKIVKSRYKPAKLVPFELFNIKPFINREHPTIFPEMPEYFDYWDEQADRCIKGFWGHDYDEAKGKGGWRWMPGELYFYINFTKIEDTDLMKRTKYINPKLRDIEWLVFYALATCDGFSGFKGDEQTTCYRPIGKIQEKGIDSLSGYETEMLKRYEELFPGALRKPNGEYKDYMEARDYLYQTFDKPMGDPYFMNEYKHLVLLSTRGGGKSYMMSGVLTHGFTFNDSRDLEDYVEGKTQSVTVVGSYDTKYSTDLLDKFEKMYLRLKDNYGTYREDGYNEAGYFFHPYDGSIDPNEHVKNAVANKSGKGTVGVDSRIFHVSFRVNASAGVGKRARRIIIEEAGLLQNFKKVHQENKGSFGRDILTGYSIYIGTGGNMKKIQGIKEAFNNPDRFDCLGFEDIYSGTKKQIGLFIPAYYRKSIYKDKNGNTDYKKAFADEMEERHRIKNDKDADETFEGHIISYPVIPAEMFLESGENIFDTERAQSRIMDLEEGLWHEKAKIGTLHYIDKKKTMVKFDLDLEDKLKPIIRLGDEDGMKDKSGAVVIYESPLKELPKPSFRNFQYIVVYDPVRNDKGEGSSLASVLVFKTWQLDDLSKIQYNLVAEWVGRHYNLSDDHETALKLASYYNAKVLPEVNVNHFVTYTEKQRKYDMLQPEPSRALDATTTSRRKSRKVGVYVAPGMKPKLAGYVNDLLRKEIDRDERIIGDEYINRKILMMDQIYSLRLLDEIVAYRDDGNFDHMSSMMVLSLQLLQEDGPKTREDQEDEEKNEEKLKGMLTTQHDRASIASNPAFNY